MKVGLVVRLWGPESTGRSGRYADVRNLALHAEAVGFDSIWVEDHLLYRDAQTPTIGVWECWTSLAALAEATDHIELGTLVSCTQFRNPAILAKMATTLDEISEGRFTLGLGAGWHRPEFDAFGIPFDHRVDRFEEALQIIVPLLREGKVDFEGRFYWARKCEAVPRGPRVGGPPILIGAWKPRMFRLAAQYADRWDVGGFLTTPSSAAEKMAAMKGVCQEVGRDPDTLQVTAGISVAYPTLAPVPPDWGDYLAGTQDIVEALRGFQELGIAHLTCWLYPNTVDAVTQLAMAIEAYSAMRDLPDASS